MMMGGSMKDIPAAYKDEFYKSCCAEYADLSEILAEFSASNRKRALDFGSGLGRLSLMLYQRMGIAHVLVASAEMRRPGVQDHVQFLVSGPDLLQTAAENRFDLVIAMIALQHMVPPLMAVYIEQFCDI
jgi:cyclopropane fatty-acyl-phospholipid synthase-like methyltransferase